MNIMYESKGIEECFTDYTLLKKKVGVEISRAIIKRKGALMDSETFGIFLSTGLGKPHSLKGSLLGYYAVSVTANYRLVFKPVSDDLSAEKLLLCEQIIIKGVEDYHERASNWIIP